MRKIQRVQGAGAEAENRECDSSNNNLVAQDARQKKKKVLGDVRESMLGSPDCSNHSNHTEGERKRCV